MPRHGKRPGDSPVGREQVDKNSNCSDVKPAKNLMKSTQLNFSTINSVPFLFTPPQLPAIRNLFLLEGVCIAIDRTEMDGKAR
jgi:hypothetical protein